MRLFLDANILVATLNKEYPLFTWSSRLLSLQGKNNIMLFTSPLCLAIAFYFSSKKSGDTVAREKIGLLFGHIGITTIDEKITFQAIENKLNHDFEDGMEYYSALQHKCDCIITENQNDFYFSDIEVIGCEAFLMKLYSSK
ncbi:MAG: PIN domain-containing protein [Prolixibacteraceae bacterium]|jgi:predicted nucleic acid-binding protein|nr:PIN domain-containing protein [Prolixibacteraceae bacterium]